MRIEGQGPVAMGGGGWGVLGGGGGGGWGGGGEIPFHICQFQQSSQRHNGRKSLALHEKREWLIRKGSL